MTSERFLRVWLPVLVWAAIIFGFSSIPSLNSGLGTWDQILRKCAHMTEYAVLGYLLLRAIGHEVWALLLGIAYSATDEFHQRFVAGRHGSPVDVAIDTIGLMIGIVLLPILLRAFVRRT